MLRKIISAVALTAFVACFSSANAAEPLAKDIDWAKDLNSARTKALEFDRPMLIVFGADWCTYCKKLERTTLSHPQMVKYINQRFVPVHLDHDKEKTVAKILEVNQLPCSVILSPEADLLGKFVGYQSPSKYFSKLSDAEKVQAKIRQASNTTAVTK